MFQKVAHTLIFFSGCVSKEEEVNAEKKLVDNDNVTKRKNKKPNEHRGPSFYVTNGVTVYTLNFLRSLINHFNIIEKSM